MLSPRYYFINDFIEFEGKIEDNSLRTALCLEGDIILQKDVTNAYYIKHGILKWCVTNEDGNTQTILFLGKGSIMPLQLATEKFTLESGLYLEAMTDCELLVISPEKIQELTYTNPAMVKAAAAYYNKICNILLSRIYMHSLNCSVSLVACVIYILDTDMGTRQFHSKITQEELVALTGISRAQTARALKTLREDGIIETGRKCIQVRNRDKLLERCALLPGDK